MIRIMCQGGLGNQLFTLNAAHILSKTYGVRVNLTFDAPNRHVDRPIQVGGLLNVCRHDLTASYKSSLFRMCDLIDRTQNRFSPLGKLINLQTIFLDTHNLEAPLSLSTTPPNLVRGYFQNANQVLRWLPSYSDEIYSFLDSIPMFSGLPMEYQAFHIRRGDYVTNRGTLGELEPEYYLNTRENSLPLIITTDYSGPKENLQKFYPGAQIIGPGDADVWTSFKILSRARKLTIANSTYSWWAGVLANGLEAEVVRPRQWNKIQTLSSEYLIHPQFREVENSFA